MSLNLVVCRDCCCGTLRKHPDVDHDGQLVQLRAAMVGRGTIRVSSCLDACEHSNVVVVTEAHGLRRRTLWLAGILTDELTRALVDWLAVAGQGAALPPLLERLRFSPRLRSRSRKIRPR